MCSCPDFDFFAGGNGGKDPAVVDIFKQDPDLAEQIENAELANRAWNTAAIVPALALAYAEAILAHKFTNQSKWTNPFLYLHDKFQSSSNRNILVDMLRNIETDRTGRGSMLVMRAQNKATAERFVRILVAAREAAGYQQLFEVVLDISGEDGNQAGSAGFVFTSSFDQYFLARLKQWGRNDPTKRKASWRPSTYNDLNGLPCILIVCEKCRFGDTLPGTGLRA